MSLPSLAAFLEAASADAALQEQLWHAADPASLAAIAQAAGYSVVEGDWLAASAADPWWTSQPEGQAEGQGEPQAEGQAEPQAQLPSLDTLVAFLHQAQGDPALRQALAEAPDAAAVATLAQEAGYPITSADLWAASEAVPEELATPPEPGLEEPEAGADPLEGFLRELESDPQLQQALAEAVDAAAVAQLAQAAGHPLREVDLWLASGLEPQHLAPTPPPVPSPAETALLALLHQAQGDAALVAALAEAVDAAAVAAIARAAGYAITPADLWAASGGEPEELIGPLLVVVEDPNPHL
jgi:predicted ribosomally synthesized peptide with nif11-like leader